MYWILGVAFLLSFALLFYVASFVARTGRKMHEATLDVNEVTDGYFTEDTTRILLNAAFWQGLAFAQLLPMLLMFILALAGK